MYASRKIVRLRRILRWAAIGLIPLAAGIVRGAGPPGNRVTGAVYEKVYETAGTVSSRPSKDASVGLLNRDEHDSTSRDGLYYIVTPGELEKFQLVAKKEGYQTKYSQVYRNELDPIKAARIDLDPIDPQAAEIRGVLDGELNALRATMSGQIKDLVFADLMRILDRLAPAQRAYVRNETARLAAVEGPHVSWRVSVSGVRRPFTESLEFLSRRVARRTNGRFNMALYYQNQLGPFAENLEKLGKAQFEAAIFCADERRTPALSALNLPFLPFRDLDVTRKVQDDYFRQAVVVKEMERWNVQLLMANPAPQREFMGIGNPPADFDGWKGRRVAAFGPLGDAMGRIGSVPTPSVSGPEAYMALKESKVEAIALPLSYVPVRWNLQDVAKWYTSNMRAGSDVCPIAANADAWRKLPESYRRLINESTVEAYQELRAAYSRSDQENMALFARVGLTEVRYMDPERSKFVAEGGFPTWQQWVKEREAKGLPGSDLLNHILTTAKNASGG